MLELDKYIKLDKAALKATNLADRFDEVDLRRIGNYVFDGYEQDDRSRRDWARRMEAAMDLALQLQKEKTFPWVNASNVAFPLVTIATLQFHSRAYPTLVSGTDIVNCRVIGPDPELAETNRAQRVSTYMSYQVLEEDQAWEEQQDRLLISIPIVGCAFKKSYYDANKGHNISELVMAKDLVMDYFAKSVETAQRKTHILPKYRNEIYEKVKLGVYRDILEESWYVKGTPQPEANPRKDARTGQTPPVGSAETPFCFLEQHCYLDLDGDGYAEPYVVLIEKSTHDVIRIVTRFDREEDIARTAKGEIISIQAVEYFTKYGFIPSPDGGIYDLGFGILLGPLNESVNTLINQLIDAGTMSSLGGGFLGRGVKIRGGTYGFAPMEWKRVDSTGDDLRKNIVPIPTNAPSDVLFQLLGLLIDFTNRVSGATEMLAGANPGQNTAATTSDHMVEQGLKIYAAIFKRTWRSMKEEFKKLYILNGIYLPTQKGLPGGGLALREDYLGDPNRIVPAADPNITSDSMRIMQAQTLAQRAATVPGYDVENVERHLLRTMRVQGWETLYKGVDPAAPPPKDVKVTIQEMKMQVEAAKLEQAKQEFVIEMMSQQSVNEAEIKKLEAMATKLLSDSEDVNVNQQINAINTMIGLQKVRNDDLKNRLEFMLGTMELRNDQANNTGAVGGLGTAPSNTGNALPPAELGI